MITPNYETQWQKITSAYVNNRLHPYINCACFIGNLLNGRREWSYAKGIGGGVTNDIKMLRIANRCILGEAAGIYSIDEILAMEDKFMSLVSLGDTAEDDLYDAMVSTLEMLRKIHESKGDETAREIPLTKRQLQTS